MKIYQASLIGSVVFFSFAGSSCERKPKLVFDATGEDVILRRNGEVITWEQFEKIVGNDENFELPVTILSEKGEMEETAGEMNAVFQKQLDIPARSAEFIRVDVGDFNYGVWPPG